MFKKVHDDTSHAAAEHKHFDLSVLGLNTEAWLVGLVIFGVIQFVKAWRLYDKLILEKQKKKE